MARRENKGWIALDPGPCPTVSNWRSAAAAAAAAAAAMLLILTLMLTLIWYR